MSEFNTDAPARWFRMYSEFLTDDKVQMLNEVDQRRYVMILCLRCKNGSKPIIDDAIRFYLRITPKQWSKTKESLLSLGLINNDNGIPTWEKRQYISDHGTERVKAYRDRRRAAGLKPQSWFPKGLREKIYERDGNKCVYCSSDKDLTIDHMIPTLRGGADSEDNLQTCCRICNADKRHMTHDEYISWAGRVTLLNRNSNAPREQRTEIIEQRTEEDINNLPVTRTKPVRFIPPTLEEVSQYCQSRNNIVDPVKFHAFYSSKGWKVGRSPMKDWRACVVTWERGN